MWSHIASPSHNEFLTKLYHTFTSHMISHISPESYGVIYHWHAMGCLFQELGTTITKHGTAEFDYIGADSRFAHSQWETALQSNDISHSLGTSLESALYINVRYIRISDTSYQWQMYEISKFGSQRTPGGRFKNTYELLNLRALKISKLHKNHIFQCMGKIFCVEFQRVPLKFHTKYLTHTLKDVDFIHIWKFKSSLI